MRRQSSNPAQRVEWEVIGEPSDEAIRAWATYLLSLVERDLKRQSMAFGSSIVIEDIEHEANGDVRR